MDKFTDIEYLKLLSPQLKRFTPQSGGVWKFRCPFCGDSAKNEFKTRCYVYPKSTGLKFHCHNCGEHGGVYKLLKHVNPELAREYAFKSFLEPSQNNKTEYTYTERVQPLPVSIQHDINLPTISELPDDHSAKIYLKNRRIPPENFDRLFFTDNFKKFIMDISPDEDKIEKLYEEPRIIIPIHNRNGVLVGVQGNSWTSPKKYIIVQLIEEQLIFGIDKIDETKPILILEGAYDSLFLPNSIAGLSSSAMDNIELDNTILVYDNEPRNKDTVRFMEKAIHKNKKVVIWPETIAEKDINNMVLSGMDPKEIYTTIQNNTFDRMRATLEITKWKRV